METVLQGFPMVVCFLDDGLVTGRNDEEHLENVLKYCETMTYG